MQFLIKFMYIFAIGSLFGWVLEFIYRSIRLKKLINPGFLTGPALPIYGFGNILLYCISNIDLYFIKSVYLRYLVFFLLVAVFMTLLELATGYLFYNFMQIRLWNYSNRFGNINGFVCPLFSFYWGIIGLVYYLVLAPFITRFLLFVQTSFLFTVLIIIFYAVLTIDIFWSFRLWIKIRNSFLKFCDMVVVNLQEIKEKFSLKMNKEHQFVFFSILFRLNSVIKRNRLKYGTYFEKENDYAKLIDVEKSSNTEEQNSE